MIVNIVFLSLTFAFIIYCAVSAGRKFIGYNPEAPSLRERWKAWVKRNIVDDDPYDTPENDRDSRRSGK